MNSIMLVLILWTPTGQITQQIPQPNMEVCMLEKEKVYRKTLKNNSLAIVYCRKK